MNLKEAQNIVTKFVQHASNCVEAGKLEKTTPMTWEFATAIKIVSDEVLRAQSEAKRYHFAHMVMHSTHCKSHAHWTAKNAKLRQKLDKARDDVRTARRLLGDIPYDGQEEDFENFMCATASYSIPVTKEDYK